MQNKQLKINAEITAYLKGQILHHTVIEELQHYNTGLELVQYRGKSRVVCWAFKSHLAVDPYIKLALSLHVHKENFLKMQKVLNFLLCKC